MIEGVGTVFAGGPVEGWIDKLVDMRVDQQAGRMVAKSWEGWLVGGQLDWRGGWQKSGSTSGQFPQRQENYRSM